jgi:hypothetical protein
MIKSEAINELATALAKAQGEICAAKKDSENPFFKSKYADLASVWSAIKEPLSKNGLSIVQTIDCKKDDLFEVYVETVLLHSSGQFLTSLIPVRAKDDSAQGMGSAITYARRYALAAIVGVYQDDDDGNAASGKDKTDNADKDKKPTGGTKPKDPPKNETPISMGDVALVYDKAASKWGLKKEDVDHRLFDSYGVTSAKALKKFQFDKLMTDMDKK